MASQLFRPSKKIILLIFVSVFGLGTLIFIGLEIAMHATMNNTDCINNVVIAHPILQVTTKTLTLTVSLSTCSPAGSLHLPPDALLVRQLHRHRGAVWIVCKIWIYSSGGHQPGPVDQDCHLGVRQRMDSPRVHRVHQQLQQGRH